MRQRWLLAGGVMGALMALGFCVVSGAYLESRARHHLSLRVREVARLMALGSAPALAWGEAPDGPRPLEVLDTVPEALFGVLSRADGTTVAAWHPERVAARDGASARVLAHAPVVGPGGERGLLLVGLSTEAMTRDVRHAWGLLAAGCLLLWLLGMGTLVRLGGAAMGPLEHVTRALERLAGRTPVPEGFITPGGRDEPERLAAALARLEAGRDTQVSVLEGLIDEALTHQERLYTQQGLLDTRMRELRLLQDQLVVADRRTSVGTLSAGVAHEINNPLAYITANIQFAQQEFKQLEEVLRPLAPEEVDWAELLNALSEASDGCIRVQHIVQSLKSFACGDDGKSHSVELASALKTAVNMARNEIRHRASLVVDPSVSARVDANEVRLAQVFLNLLINAAHAISPGDVEHNEIRVSMRHGTEGEVRVSITDTGSGMTPEVQGRLFTPFFTTKPIGVGTGLGLSVCQGLVHGMGGEIEVLSEPGKGSTFTVILPAARTALRALVPGKVVAPQAPRARLLVVDDEPRVAISLRRALSREHEVTVASSAREALARLVQAEPFDVILCDLMMPEMNGMEFFHALQRDHAAQAESVLFISGGAFTEETRGFLEAHEARLLRKPMDMDTLRERLRQLVDARRLARRAPEGAEALAESAPGPAILPAQCV
ncbi:ATP-binding protein [Melittangium boletus]|uniref:ATP-binding protein n=1 Tax=Melittangium boletus TaxID=83453 RepID=UPI003DA4C82A